MNEPDYIVEIGGKTIYGGGYGQPRAEAEISRNKARNRKYISVLFQCCNVYQRVYRNHAGTAYEGFCPQCLRKVRVRIGRDGSNCRFFAAT